MASTDTTKQWLGQLQDAPIGYTVVNIPLPTYTVYAVPDILRAMSPEYHQRTELQLGLHNRTVQTAGTQQLKCDIAGSLHMRLHNSGKTWASFASAVVGDAATARGHYQNGATVPDEVVPYMLAADALFLVVFFQYLNNTTFFFQEFAHLGPRLGDTARTLIRSDLLLVENQVPMYLLKRVVRELLTLRDGGVPPDDEVEDELYVILKVAVCHLYPVGHPERFDEYLNMKYTLEPITCSLQNCKHLLDCVYVVLCGHALPLLDAPLGSTPSKLDSIPSVTRLRAVGICVTDTAATLDRIGLHGSGYVTSACLRLPKVDVYDFTEMVFHNLAVHEQLVNNGRRGEVRCFLQCMASLSSDEGDLRLLVDHGVVDNKVGSNVLGMWERVLRGVNTASPSASWRKCYQDIHMHRRSRVKRWRREIWVLFFSKPWTFVGFLAASAILFLTALQTWFTVVNSSRRGWRWPSEG